MILYRYYTFTNYARYTDLMLIYMYINYIIERNIFKALQIMQKYLNRRSHNSNSNFMDNIKTQEPELGKVFANTGKILKDNARTFAISSALFFALYTFLYGVWKVPAVNFAFTRMSEVNFVDISYLLAITVMSGALLVLMRQKIKASPKTSKLGGIGGIFAGFVAAACPVCQGITLVAFGSTAAFIPLGALSSFVWVMQLVALFVLWISIYLTSVSIYTKTCITCEIKPKADLAVGQPSGPHLLDNNRFFVSLAVIALLVIANQFLLSGSGLVTASSSGGGTVSLADGFNYGPKLTLKPMPLAAGEQPRIAGYKAIVKTLPTISEMNIQPSTGDVVQDLVNNIVPKGTPWYGQEAGVSFDDPIGAQKLWAKGKAIQLSADEEARWGRIVNSFTCDYCCGSPQQPTIITRCGCAHSQAAQGMARWFIKNYGDKYSDEEIYGELARWYALWYPGPTVKRIAQEMGIN